jgi:hypothetical protein
MGPLVQTLMRKLEVGAVPSESTLDSRSSRVTH